MIDIPLDGVFGTVGGLADHGFRIFVNRLAHTFTT
jgi:hypothetical protein